MDFEYKMEITADPEEVFAALTNPFQIELWSGYPADMKAEEGYVFSLWEGDITGVNLEVVPGKLLVQEWFFGEQEKQSIVRITLKKEGARTLVGLTHTHIPEVVYEEITGGWKECLKCIDAGSDDFDRLAQYFDYLAFSDFGPFPAFRFAITNHFSIFHQCFCHCPVFGNL